MRSFAALLVFGLTACTSGGADSSKSEPSPPRSESRPADGCGELSYGIRHNSGDDFETIAARSLAAIPCATPCNPKPTFALGSEGRNEHGGYGFIELDPRECEFEGTALGVESCVGICDSSDVLGRFQVTLRDQTPESRARLCNELEARWGPPDVGSCACLDDEIVWRPRPDEPGASLEHAGGYTLDCGFPDANYVPDDLNLDR